MRRRSPPIRAVSPRSRRQPRRGWTAFLWRRPGSSPLQGLFGDLFLETAGRDREKGEAFYDAFRRYGTMAHPTQEEYLQQLLNALVLVQRFGELYSRG